MNSDPVLSRRDFVKRLRAAAVASSLVSPGLMNAASYGQVTGANDRIVLGLIGCGGRGQDVMRHFLELGVTVRAVCDPDERRMAEAQQLAGGNADKIRDFRNLLERKEIDAVIVATPPLACTANHPRL